MVRTEVNCNKCGSHLGHVFDDGPKPTNLSIVSVQFPSNMKKMKKRHHNSKIINKTPLMIRKSRGIQ